MRLTLVTETFAPQVNGVSRTLGQLVNHLERAGDAVQVVHPDYGHPPAHPDHHPVPSWVLPFYQEVSVPRPPFGRVFRAIEAFRPDLIHVATEATLGWSALRFALRKRIPVVSSFHTNFDQYSDHYRLGWARWTIWRYLRWFHNRTLETYVPSEATIADLAAKGFERLVLWPRGVDGQLFRPDRPGRDEIRRTLGFEPDDVVIGHVSRLAAEKNVLFLAEALQEVAERCPNVRFLFVGDGPARPELERRMGPRARFVGYRGGTDLADHYAAADLFAFASVTETFGNVVLEALASGLPVVAIKAGGVGGIIRSGETGILVEPGSPASQMASALVGLVESPALRREMAEAARIHALGQTWDAIMGRLRDHYLAAAGLSAAVGSPGGA
jgi:glycosyltransferase involved in cell wall biosynthesis